MNLFKRLFSLFRPKLKVPSVEDQVLNMEAGVSSFTPPSEREALLAMSENKKLLLLIKKVAKRWNMDFAVLSAFAVIESSLNPKAKAPTSSASGLFQFIEKTWVSLCEMHGKKYGVYTGSLAKETLLDLRFDPELSTEMMGELVRENDVYLTKKLGRPPSVPELYMAHFLGPKQAFDLIQAEKNFPNKLGTEMFPKASKTNTWVFLQKGKALTCRELYKRIHQKLEKAEEDVDAIIGV